MSSSPPKDAVTGESSKSPPYSSPAPPEPENIFEKKPGFLAQVQKTTTTSDGRRISPSMLDHLLSAEEVAKLEASIGTSSCSTYNSSGNWGTPVGSPFLGPPFNALSKVTDHLGLGGFASLSVDNLSTVFPDRRLALIVNATYEVPAFRPKTESGRKVESLRIPVGDDANADLYAYFGDFIEKIEAIVAKDDGQVAVVHCMAGVSRSATLAASYLMKTEKLSLELAFKRLHSIRPVVRPNLNFLRQLAQHEEDLFGKRGEWVSVGDIEEGVSRRVPRFIAESQELMEQYRF